MELRQVTGKMRKVDGSIFYPLKDLRQRNIGVLFGCFGRRIDGTGLPGGLIIYQGHLFPQKDTYAKEWILTGCKYACIYTTAQANV